MNACSRPRCCTTAASREDNVEALKLIDRALELDPEYAHAHAWRGCILGQAWGYGWCADQGRHV